MKALSAMDQVFLLLENRTQPMHVAGMQLLRPPEGAPEDWLQQEVAKLKEQETALPPFNQRLLRKVTGWHWVEDDQFDLEGHFRHLQLPKPGRIRELLALVSQLHSSPLDRGRPLWEAYVIDGLEDGRFAMYTKIHHSMVDGVAAVRLLQKMMTTDPDARDLPPPWALPRKARPPRDETGGGALGALAQVFSALKVQASTLPTVAKELLTTIRDARSDPDFVSAFQAPRCVLNQRITGSRRFAAQSWPLARIKAAGKKHGATINDVVLAMCASALRAYLVDRDALPKKPLIAMVPMSLRTDDSDAGNQIAMILANLATDLDDPLARLEKIQGSVKQARERYARMNQAEIVNYLAAIMAPSGINLVTGIAPKWQSYNVVISNVPGPKQTLYWNGATLEGTYPVSIVTNGQALNITLNSYGEDMEVGLIACRRTLPHMQRLLDHLEAGLAELEAA